MITPTTLHKQLLEKIIQHARKTEFDIGHYVGTTHTIYNLPTPTLHTLAREFRNDYKDLSHIDIIELADMLFHADSYEEKIIATMILGNFKDTLVTIPAALFDTWLGLLTGWAEVDTFCDEIDYWLRSDPDRGTPLLKKWNTDQYLEKRRASLVVLCNSVRHDPDRRWKTLALSFIETLTHEKHVMISKAISWILRAMIKYHKEDVAAYLKTHTETLPKIAIREVTKKLLTGRKN